MDDLDQVLQSSQPVMPEATSHEDMIIISQLNRLIHNVDTIAMAIDAISQRLSATEITIAALLEVEPEIAQKVVELVTKMTQEEQKHE